jgi:hypothetical protein
VIGRISIFAVGLVLGLVLGYRVAGSNKDSNSHSASPLLVGGSTLPNLTRTSPLPSSEGSSPFSISPELIAKLNVAGADSNLHLTPDIKELLKLSDGEVSKLEISIEASQLKVQALDLEHRQMIEKNDHGMTFEIGEFFDVGGKEVEDELHSKMAGIIGQERGGVLWRQLRKSFDYASGRFGRVTRHFKVESLPDRDRRVSGTIRFEVSAHKDPDRIDSLMSQEEIRSLSINVSVIQTSAVAPPLFSHLFTFDEK